MNDALPAGQRILRAFCYTGETDTVLNEDRLPHYKLMAARFDVVKW